MFKGNKRFVGCNMKKLPVFILLILPAVLVFTAATLHYSQGPYWISYNSDPEYLYLLKSLALTELKQSGTTGNPGTTLQILGAAVLKITYALDPSKKDSLEFTVLRNPELYLTVINTVLVAFNTLLLFILGIVAFNLTKNIWLSLLMQISPFFSNAILTNALPRISAEPLLLFTVLLFELTLIKIAFSKNLSESAHKYMIILALISGFGVATKITFIPLLIIPFFILPKLRNKIGFLFLTIFSFMLWTLPIFSQYKILFNWYYKIFTHTGYYGLGAPGIIDLGIYLQNIMNIFMRNPLFFLILLLSFGFILTFGIPLAKNASRKNPWQDIIFRILEAVTIAQLFAVLIVAKHFTDRYLLPVMSLSGLMLFLIFIYLRQLELFNRINLKKFILFIGIIFIIGSAWTMIGIRNVIIQNMQIRDEALAINQLLETEYKDYLRIPILRCSSQICALAFGNFYTNNALFSETLQKIYGDVHFFDGLSNEVNGSFHTWAAIFPVEDIIASGRGNKIILHGSPPRYLGDTIAAKTGLILKLRDVLGGEYETIYAPAGYAITKQAQRQPSSQVLETTDFDFSTHPRKLQ